MIVSLIAAYSIPDRAIGYQGALPWHLPADLARFRRLTMGHTLLMGRRTFESLQGKKLPGRRIIVLSPSLDSAPPGADSLAGSLSQGLRQAQYQFEDMEAFIAGGGQIYERALALDVVERMYLTLVHASVKADTYFPEVDLQDWELVESEQYPADATNAYGLTFQTLIRTGLAPAA